MHATPEAIKNAKLPGEWKSSKEATAEPPDISPISAVLDSTEIQNISQHVMGRFEERCATPVPAKKPIAIDGMTTDAYAKVADGALGAPAAI